MTHDDFFDPRVPMLSEIDMVRALSRDDPEAYLARGALSPCMWSLFLQYLMDRERESTSGSEGRAAVLGTFLDLLEHLSTTVPSAADLRDAPLLDSWCAGMIEPAPHLFGRVTGHPRLRDGARIFTSPYLQVAVEQRWARTWSRYYRLGEYDRHFFVELKLDEKIPSGSELIEL